MSAEFTNSFGAKGKLTVGEREYEIFRLDVLQERFDVARLPFSLKVLLENLLRTEGGGSVSAPDIEALASWDEQAEPSKEIAFTPARVLMQDFTGVPAVVDLAAMRDAMAAMGGDPNRINPLVPAELVIDHSVQVDAFGTRDAFRINAEREFERNQERYSFLRWGQGAFDRFAVVPPDTGIVHQVNLEYLARVVFDTGEGSNPGTAPQPPGGGAAGLGAGGLGAGPIQAYPDTLVGTDSHTTMVNGLGVLGWGVGGIEAEAAMLGQPMSMLIPQVLGFKLHGALPEGATATDLVLTVTEMLRERGVVGKFVEFYGAGLARPADSGPRDDRQHVPRVRLHLRDLPHRRRDAALLGAVGPAGRADRAGGGLRARAGHVARGVHPRAGLLREDGAGPGRGRASIAGPKRPQDRVALREAKRAFGEALRGLAPDYDGRDESSAESFPSSDSPATAASTHASGFSPSSAGANGGEWAGGLTATHPSSAVPLKLADGSETSLDHGHVVIAAITSCTNTSNPSVMIGAGILARNALARGLYEQAVGEDLACARLEGRHRIPRQGGPDRVAGGAGLRPGRLRLHHLHRQLRPAARGGLAPPSARATSPSSRSSRATATSRGGSTRT